MTVGCEVRADSTEVKTCSGFCLVLGEHACSNETPLLMGNMCVKNLRAKSHEESEVTTGARAWQRGKGDGRERENREEKNQIPSHSK